MERAIKPYIVFLSGPTASGKTAVSLSISKFLSIEVVNADMGQFYAPLSIGTAKPDWKNQPIPHHLFDIITEPKDLNVAQFRTLLIKTVNDVWKRGNIPVVVGGSLFYLRSLFWPPFDIPFKPFDVASAFANASADTQGDASGVALAKTEREGQETSPFVLSEAERSRMHLNGNSAGWEKLYQIDPERAQAIDKNDIYRIKRALDIWEQTGKKPSEFVPEFDFPFDFYFAFIDMPRGELYDRINGRTEQMLKAGWIDEVKALRGTAWEKFLKIKKLIGYPTIFEWIERGERGDERELLVAHIQQETRKFAKRQLTFWNKLKHELDEVCCAEEHMCSTMTFAGIKPDQIARVVDLIKKDSREKNAE